MLLEIDKLLLTLPFFNTVYRKNYALLIHYALIMNRKVGFFKAPSFVQWLTTYNCNLRCPHCEASSNEMSIDELTTEQITDAVVEIGKMGVRLFFLSGGEPLLRNDVFEVMQLAKRAGLKLGIGTNSYLTEKYSNELSTLDLSLYFTSIDGLEETHDRFRGVKGSYKKVFEALRFMKELNVPERKINTVFHSNNLEEFDDLFHEIRRSAANVWRISIIIPVGRGRNNTSLLLNNNQIINLFSKIKDARRTFPVELSGEISYVGKWEKHVRTQPFAPKAGTYHCSIMPDGEVLGSQLAYDNRYSEGNIKEQHFETIWKNGFARFKKLDLPDECNKCKYLHACFGGSWALRLVNYHCFKEVFKPNDV